MAGYLGDFMASQAFEAVKGVTNWEVEQDGELLRVSIPAKDGERYRLQIDCNGCPATAPSVVFVNADGVSSDAKAWPKATGKLSEVVKPPPNCFLCMPLTKEGLTHHPDWAAFPVSWQGGRRTPMDIINYVQDLLHGPDYVGRGP